MSGGCGRTFIVVESFHLDSRSPSRPARAELASLAACVLLVLVRGVVLASASVSEQIARIPDDAFYYLTVAANRATLGRWTFDGGLSSTSGFHLLHGYLNVVLARVLGGPPSVAVIVANMALGCAATIAALFVVTRLLRRLDAQVSPALLLVGCSSSFLVLATAVMEWHWVVLIAAGYQLLVFGGEGKSARTACLTAALLGFLGSLARLDFGAMPAVVFASSVAVSVASRRRFRFGGTVARSAAGLLGAVVGVAAVLAHNALLFEHALPGSARVKSLLGARLADLPIPYGLVSKSLGLDLVVMASRGRLAGVALVLVALVVVAVWRSRREPADSAEARRVADRRAAALAALLTIATYFLLYARLAGVQIWYTANLVVPSFVWMGLALAVIPPTRLARVATGAFAVALAAFNTVRSAEPLWPWQDTMRRAGVALASSPPDARVGAWNAGILGYFEGGHIVNLDGLMNNDVLPFLRDERLACYLIAHDIGYVAELASRTGPEPGAAPSASPADLHLLRALEPVEILAEGRFDPVQLGRPVVLYRFQRQREAPWPECGDSGSGDLPGVGTSPDTATR